MGVFFQPNRTVEEGGGFTSKLIPYQLTKTGVAVGFGVGAAAALGTEMLRQHNKMKMGPVSYEGGPARMTHNVTSGAVEAIKEATNDPAVQADMLKKMVRTDDGILNNIDEFGADTEFVSAFYGMG